MTLDVQWRKDALIIPKLILCLSYVFEQHRLHAQNVLRRLVKALKKPPDKNTQKAPNALGRRVGGKKELFAFPATQLEVSQLELPALPAWRWQAVFLNLQGFLCATNTKAVKIILLETQHS